MAPVLSCRSRSLHLGLRPDLPRKCQRCAASYQTLEAFGAAVACACSPDQFAFSSTLQAYLRLVADQFVVEAAGAPFLHAANVSGPSELSLLVASHPNLPTSLLHRNQEYWQRHVLSDTKIAIR